MNKKYIFESKKKLAFLVRFFAKCVDLFIVLILAVAAYPFGIFLGLFYIAVCDAMVGGQSVGKRLMGFCVVSIKDGKPCSLKQAFIRNLPFFIPIFFLLIPVWGWIFAFFIGTPLGLFEIYLLLRIDSGHRLGDVMADTTVMVLLNNGNKGKKSRKSWFNDEKNAISQ